MSNKYTNMILVIIGLAVILALLVWLLPERTEQQNGTSDTSNGQQQDMNNQDEMVQYTNEEFGFTLRHPENWQVRVESLNEPIVNIYKPDTVAGDQDFPLTHHSNFTGLVIAPRGIGTEGVLAASRQVDTDFTGAQEATSTEYFLTDNDQVYAYFVSLQDSPESWNQSGFIWAQAEVENYNVGCSDPNLDPLECASSDEENFIVTGNVSEQERQQIFDILKTFEFTQ